MKNTLKILILILSVALVIGALVMAVGAEEQKDGYVSLKIGDVTFPDMTLDEALAKVLTVNHTVIKAGEDNVYTEGEGDSAITVTNPKKIYADITLLGNVKQTVKYDNQDFDYNGDGAADIDGRATIRINLNGYDYDMSAAPSDAFSVQRSTKSIYFNGEGSIKMRSSSMFLSNSGGAFYFHGEGRGIRLYSDVLVSNFATFYGSGGLYEFKNCHIDIDAEINNAVSGSLFKVDTNTANGVHLNMYNCTVEIDIALSTTEKKNASGYYVFEIGNCGHVYVENSYINTDASGINSGANGVGGDSNKSPAGSLAFLMENSTLRCVADHPTTIASAKDFAHEPLDSYILQGSATAKGDIRFRNSYVSGTFRPITGFGNTTAEATSKEARVLTFDGTTLEWEDAIFKSINMGVKFGPRIFQNLTYANFINGSRIILNQGNMSTGGGGGSTNLSPSYQPGVNGTNTSSGTDAHTVDLAEGTRLSKTDVGSVDLPAGCTLVEDKVGDLECPYVVKKSTDKVLTGSINSYSITRGIGFYEDNVLFEGRSYAHVWTLPKSTDTGYKADGVTGTFADGKVTISNSSYPSLNAEQYLMGSESPYSVIMYQFDFMTFDNTIPLEFQLSGKNGSDTTKIHTITTLTPEGGLKPQYNIKNAEHGVAPGLWNSLTLLLDAKTHQMFIYVNDVMIDARVLKAEDFVKVQEMRLNLEKGTYAEGAKVAFSNIRKIGLASGTYLDSTNALTADNAAVYRDYFAYPEREDGTPGAIMVGNTTYKTLNEALLAAQATNSSVTLYQDYKEAENVTAWGWVNTNGFKMDKVTSELETEAYEGGIRFIKPTYIDLHFYTGVADDPAADTDNMKTYVYIKNGRFFIPDDLKVDSIVLDEGLLYASGWLKGEYINPGAYSTAAAYLEAVKGKTPVDVTTEAVLEEATYYPVYSYAAYTVAVGGTVSYYGSNVELADAINENLTDSVKVKLYTDVEASKPLAAGSIDNTYLRKAVSIDLNGNRFTYQSNSSFAYGASDGNMAVYSSKAGGELVHIGKSKTDVSSAVQVTNAMFSVTQTATLTMGEVGEASADNLTVYSANLLNQAAGSTATDAVQINGGTYVKLGASKEAMFNFGKKNYELEIKNAIFVDASAVSQGESEGADKIFALKENVTLNLTECNVIANGGKAQFMSLSEGAVVNLTGCKIAGTLASSVGEIILDNATSAYMTVGDNVKAKDESKILTNANTKWSDETVTYRVVRPVVGSVGADLSSYVYVTNDPDFVAKDAYKIILIPDMNIMPVAKAECTEYSWCDLSSEVFMKTYVRTGDDPLDFAHLITPLVPTEAMETLVLGATERWTLWGETTLIPGKQVVGTVSDFKGYVDLTLGSSIGIYFYVAEENYSVLDADTKAMFSENAITIGGASYRMAKNVKFVKANEAFSDAVYEITLKERGYSYKLTYSISLYDYIAKTFATEGLDASAYKLAYYLGEYLADVYGAFDTEDNEDGAAIIAALVASNSSYAESGDITLPEYATNMGSAAGKIDIKVDLSASPTYVITSSVDGKVNWCGAEVQLLAGVAVRLSAEACDFDNVMTFSLSDGSIGSYCYGDYVEGVAGDASASEVAKSFYNYITFAEGYRK